MIEGDVAPGWDAVRDAFAQVLDLDQAGASVAVVHDGQTVVDLWGGRDPLSSRAWQHDSVTLAFSTAKGVLSILVAQEIEAGRIDPEAPVAEYWPGFGHAGKRDITVRDVMTHVAGLPVLPIAEFSDLADPIALAVGLAARAPEYPPRSARIYHPLSFGTLVGELLRRVTGSDISTLVQDRMCAPLGGTAWFGVPGREHERYLPALMGPVAEPPRPVVPAGADGRACEAAYRANAQLTPVFTRVDDVQGSEPMNGTDFLRAHVGGGGLVADARSIARIYGACVSEVDGVRLIGDATARFVARDHLGGIPEPRCQPGAVPTTRWGLGFEISHVWAPMLGEGSFGHAGMGGRLSFAHTPSRLGFSFIGQRMEFPAAGQDPRWRLLLDAVSRSLG